jgi:hypothetical protein
LSEWIRRGSLLALLLLLTRPLLAMDDSPPVQQAGELCLSLPTPPLAFLASESDSRLTPFWQDLSRSSTAWQHGTTELARLSPVLRQVALVQLFVDLLQAAPDGERAAESLLVLMPSSILMDPMPKVALIVRPHRSVADGQALCRQFAGEIPLVFPGEAVSRTGGPRVPLYATSHKKLLFFADHPDHLTYLADRWGRPVNRERVQAPLRRCRTKLPGPVWGYLDPTRVVPLLSLTKPAPAVQVLLRQLLSLETVGLSLSRAEGRTRLQVSALAPSIIPGRGTSGLLLPWHVAFKGVATAQGGLLFSGEMGTEWAQSRTRWITWMESLLPSETEATRLLYGDLALLTGLHPARALDEAATGALTLWGGRERPDDPFQAGLCLGVSPSHSLQAFLTSSSRWGRWFAGQGLAERWFSPVEGQEGRWLIRGAPEGALRWCRLESGTLSLTTREGGASLPSLVKGRPALVSLDGKADAQGANLALSWVQGGDLIRCLSSLTEGVTAGQRALAPTSEVPLPVLALRILLSAGATYRGLALGRFNRTSGREYPRDLHRLNRDRDRRGERLALIPDLLLKATFSPREIEAAGSPSALLGTAGSRSLGGYCFLPAVSRGGRALRWERECVYLALPMEAGQPYGYAIDQTGVVFRARVEQLRSRALPRDWKRAGFQAVSHLWSEGSSPPEGAAVVAP